MSVWVVDMSRNTLSSVQGTAQLLSSDRTHNFVLKPYDISSSLMAALGNGFQGSPTSVMTLFVERAVDGRTKELYQISPEAVMGSVLEYMNTGNANSLAVPLVNGKLSLVCQIANIASSESVKRKGRGEQASWMTYTVDQMLENCIMDKHGAPILRTQEFKSKGMRPAITARLFVLNNVLVGMIICPHSLLQGAVRPYGHSHG